MESVGQISRELEEALRELSSARDQARLRAHLLSMDTRRRLADLEQEIESFERRLSARGDWIVAHVVATARSLTHAALSLASRSEPEPARVRDLMTREPVSCRPFESLSEAAQRMSEGNLGVLPVVDDIGKPIGMLTDRDICLSAYERGEALKDLSVSHAMSQGARTCKATQTLRAAMDLMVTHQVRRLPVVGETGVLVGIVSLADVARHAQAPSSISQEARAWVAGVLAGICESISAERSLKNRAS